MTKNYGAYKVNYEFNSEPKVSIIFDGPLNEQEVTLKRFIENTYYGNVEFLIPKTLEKNFSLIDNRIIFVDAESLNDKASKANGKYLMFLNTNLEPENSRWLNELINFAQKPEVGIVGGKLINDKDVILNVGVSINCEEKSLSYEQRGVSNKSIGYYFRPTLPREIQAITEDCLLIRKSDFDSVSGFNEKLNAQLKGVDLSLKMLKESKKVIFTPYAGMIARDENNYLQGKDSAKDLFELWDFAYLHDTYKNPNSLN